MILYVPNYDGMYSFVVQISVAKTVQSFKKLTKNIDVADVTVQRKYKSVDLTWGKKPMQSVEMLSWEKNKSKIICTFVLNRITICWEFWYLYFEHQKY